MLKEDDIRPSHLMDKQKEVMLADVKRLISKRDQFVNVACPACESTSMTKRFEKRGFQYFTCMQCGTFFMNPRPPADVLGWFYEGSVNYAYWNAHIFPASEDVRREKIFVPRVNTVLDICKKFNVPTRSLLEVGAGFGTFCVEMKKRAVFKKIVCIEPTPDLAKRCVERGLEVINKPIEAITFPEKETFDVIVNFEVIEHLFYPKDFILHCKKLLSKNGILILTCPNGKGFDIDLLGPLSDSVDHEHLNYFNPASLSSLISRCGFDVLEVLTPGKLDAELVRKKVLSHEFDISTDPFLKHILIDEWDKLGDGFQSFLSKHMLSSNMMIIARKR